MTMGRVDMDRGGQGKAEVDRGGGGVEKGSCHDITPLLCHYVSERCRASSMLGVAQGTQSGGRGGVWGIWVLEVELLYGGWGMDFHVREPHVIQV